MIINLISGPRNVSTALMYSFAQRSDTTVQDEPFYAYYLKKTGLLHPGKKRILDTMSSDIDFITDRLIRQNHGAKIIFLKNMAHHHVDIPKEFMQSVKSIFLVRRPDELIASFSKVIKDPTMDDIGVKKSWELFNELKEMGQDPAIIDSGELLKDPEMMLGKMCAVLKIKFDQNMLSWPAGKRKEDGVWAKYWYSQVHKTTGFVNSEPKKVEVPEESQTLCDEAMGYYEQLYARSIKLS